jgi:hypothetical protein
MCYGFCCVEYPSGGGVYTLVGRDGKESSREFPEAASFCQEQTKSEVGDLQTEGTWALRG